MIRVDISESTPIRVRVSDETTIRVSVFDYPIAIDVLNAQIADLETALQQQRTYFLALLGQLSEALSITNINVGWDSENEQLTVDVTSAGGFTPYTTEWELNPETFVLTVTATDAIGNTAAQTVNLANAYPISIASVDVSWNNQLVVTANASGGIGSKITTHTLNPETLVLTVTVTDSIGISAQTTVNLADVYPITISNIDVTWDNELVLDVTATGGFGAYNVEFTQASNILTVSVTDQIGITQQQQVNLDDISPIQITSATYEVIDSVAHVTVIATGGFGNLSYTCNGVTNTTGLFEIAEAGNYEISVNDEGGATSDSDSIEIELLDADTLILLSRYSGSYTNSEKQIIDEYIKSLKSAGLYTDKLSALYMFDIPLAADSLLNIIKNSYNATLIGAPTYPRGKGWKGDKIDDAINTNYNQTQDVNVSEGNFSFGAFFHNLYGLNTASMACRTSSSNIWALLEQDTSNKRRVATGGSTYITPTKTSLLDDAFITVNILNGYFTIRKNGLEITPSTQQAATAFANAFWYLLAYNNNGVPAGFTDRIVTDAFFSKHLSDSEDLALYNAIIEKNRKFHGNKINTSGFLSTSNKTAKPLHKIMVAGDSIMANQTGGDVPAEYDEGDKYRPMRLTVNNIARRIYDKLSWNKATHVRLDASEWVKSGTWNAISGERIVFEPSYNNEKYHQSTVANSYVEITIPDGVSNFAFICMRDANFDTLTVTLNGGDISSYGNATVNCNRTRVTTSDIGNPFHTEQYIGLPAGNNVIRITKGNNTNVAAIWGGFYWNGNTLMVYNVAHGGKSMKMLYQNHMPGDIVDNNPDAIVFEITLINELTQNDAYDNSFFYFRSIINNTFAGKDYLLIEPCPLGINVSTGLNSYLNYSNPNMEQVSWVMRTHIIQKNLPFINTFQMFKDYATSLGYTLEGGQLGELCTSDGAHLNTFGNDKLWEFIEPEIKLPV